ncbi:MAG: hypothetical protein VX874_13920 [Pseudomonadota bacterium]|nr:hypothetical protein [Pseudomonadota bacterium]
MMNERKAMYDLPESFPEEDFLRDGPMRHEIIVMSVEAANRQGHPDVSKDSIWTKPEHRDVMIEYLKDCRPLPIVLELMADLENGRRSADD